MFVSWQLVQDYIPCMMILLFHKRNFKPVKVISETTGDSESSDSLVTNALLKADSEFSNEQLIASLLRRGTHRTSHQSTGHASSKSVNVQESADQSETDTDEDDQ